MREQKPVAQQTVPQAAPGLRIARHRDEIDAAIARVVASGRYILGPECEHFEDEFARFLGVPFVIGVNSGTDAISLALQAVGVEAGQEVIVPAMTAAGTAVAVQRIGAVVRFADVELTTRGLSPASLAAAITARTAAVIVVHLHGTPAPLAEIYRVAKSHDLAVIEDCAQSHGALIGGRLVGTSADAAAFSFYPTKNLGALGDGGAVVVHARDYAERVRRLRNYGQGEGGISEHPGMNSRLDEMQAAVLRVLLPHLSVENAQRQAYAQCYDEALAPVVAARGRLRLPQADPGAVYHQYAIEVSDRDRVRDALLTRGIQTAIHYSPGLQRHPAFNYIIEQPTCPVADHLASTLLSLPIQPEIMLHQSRIIGALSEILLSGVR
jgi:dTDP-3-amino-3,4,6-trideoxy-alpha-D-glucose transaminase